ncbi:MAG TPA: ABC transporter substrate-binding protein [Acidimicrobiales bacterium]|nr:ABC transporter substrate-binding protein [Acidimicrobiales bacterium]
MVDGRGHAARGAVAVVVAALLALVAGCGGGDDDSTAGDGRGADPAAEAASATTVGTVAPEGAEPEAAPVLPVTVTGADGVEVTVDDASRIIPVNGDIAEVVFALGLGDDVVATDLSATYPPEADALPEIGYQRTLLAEQILGLEPTVVVANTDAGPPEVLDQLRDAHVPVVVVDYPHDLTGPAAKIRLVAQALGVPARGEALAREVDATLATATDQATERVEAAGGEPLRAAFLYLRGTNVQQVGGRGSGVDALLEAAGVVDVGVELGVDEFQPLTDESLLEAAPDVLVVTTTGLESVGGIDGLVEVPAVAGTPAGRDRRVVALDDQLLLGLGPRAGDALQELVDQLHPDD